MAAPSFKIPVDEIPGTQFAPLKRPTSPKQLAGASHFADGWEVVSEDDEGHVILSYRPTEDEKR